MPNPLVPQGILNRIKASAVFPTNPNFNITAPFLGVAGISLSLEGAAATYLQTMTGGVPSPEPVMAASLKANLIKSQALADLYKRRMESDVLMGDCTIRPDVAVAGIGIYSLFNTAIISVDPFSFNGSDAGYMVTIMGYYNINSSLFDA